MAVNGDAKSDIYNFRHKARRHSFRVLYAFSEALNDGSIVVAEMKLRDKNRTVYLLLQWRRKEPERIEFSASRTSVCDHVLKDETWAHLGERVFDDIVFERFGGLRDAFRSVHGVYYEHLYSLLKLEMGDEAERYEEDWKEQEDVEPWFSGTKRPLGYAADLILRDVPDSLDQGWMTTDLGIAMYRIVRNTSLLMAYLIRFDEEDPVRFEVFGAEDERFLRAKMYNDMPDASAVILDGSNFSKGELKIFHDMLKKAQKENKNKEALKQNADEKEKVGGSLSVRAQ